MPGRAEIDGGHKEASTLADWPPSPTLDRSGYLLELEDRFESAALADIWLPHYLPQWSSRERSAARYQVGGGRLRLLIEADQPAWSPEYAGGLRVSSLQTGVFSGPAGSTIGQHRYRDGLIVREAQPAQRLYTPRYGLFELRARFSDDPATVAALWLIGFEDEPHRSAELCIVEIFGRNVGPRRAGIGMGLHPFHDPSISDDFSLETIEIDVREPHWYAAEWTPAGVAWYVDERLVKMSRQSPDYPMQFMLDIFEFRDEPAAGTDRGYPKEFIIDAFRCLRRQ